MLCIYSMIFFIICCICFATYFTSKFCSRVVMFNLEDLVSNDEIRSSLEQVLSGLLIGILSLFDDEKNPEDPDLGGED